MSVPAPPSVPPRRRPAVLDAARTALIPLRPLTVGEILDGAFLVVRRNVRLMLGLPLVVTGALTVFLALGGGLTLLLGNSTGPEAQIALAVVLGLFGLLLAYLGVTWMTAVLCRVSLQTVLGEGFAPGARTMSLRSALSLFWPMIGLSLLQYLASSAIQTVITVLYYAVLAATLIGAGDSEALFTIMSLVVAVLAVLLAALAYGYLALTVPALVAESRTAPAWIGTPLRPTTLITSFGRSIRLVGLRNAARVALLFAATGLICLVAITLLGLGLLLVVLLYASAIGSELGGLITNPWLIGGVLAFSVVAAISVLLPFVAGVQSLLYLDLRMRREGLDLAMRFDRVPIPQPSAPPLPVMPMMPPYGWTPSPPGPPR